ncbi:MAG: IstB-like ATP-binding domain-containing protein, partial [Selenomonadaceae bacterium]|nr:IstB-like ATP-binding domain-containing protein [Selenomonadaceae bacterium]
MGEVTAMLSNDTCEKLKGMGLEAFLKGLAEQQMVSAYEGMSFEERFSLL